MSLVDHALRSIRMAATRRTAIVLHGVFIVCDPRRRQSGATIRSPENYVTGMPAFAAATGGSLCVRGLRLPKDFSSVVTALRNPNSRVRLVICAQKPEDWKGYLPAPITVPPLADRRAELDQIITQYAEDAIAELGAPVSRS